MLFGSIFDSGTVMLSGMVESKGGDTRHNRGITPRENFLQIALFKGKSIPIFALLEKGC